MRFFEEEMDHLLIERGKTEAALRRAIDEDVIEVRFKPTFDLRSGEVAAFEAFPYWEDEHVEVSAERFLTIAEETGLVHAMFAQVLRKACVAAGKWPTATRLSIDVLPGQLTDQELGASILGIAQDCGFSLDRLEIEIAESLLVRDLPGAQRALAPLREAGVKMTLDHFGTGYSSLYHIQEFKLDKVKIDRRFTENLADERSAKVMRALAGLGQGLGLIVTADGVEGSSSPLLPSGIEHAQPTAGLITTAEAAALFGERE